MYYVVGAELTMCSFHFSQWKMLYPIHSQILKILGNGILSQSFILRLKCGHPFFYELPILLSTVKLNLGHNFSQFIHRFNFRILTCWSWTVYTSKFFPIHEID